MTFPFTVQNTNFKLGGGARSDIMPDQMPNQNILLSSAESIDSELYDRMVLCFNKMLMGDRNYFTASIDCSQSLKPFVNGKPTKPLLTQDVIDDAMSTNPYRCLREYYNLFDDSSGPDTFVKRATINKNSVAMYPVFENETGEQKFICSMDPSGKLDSSIVTVAEVWRDEERGWMGKVVNCQNLIEIRPNGEKMVMQRDQQMDVLKGMILAYNRGALDYENIHKLVIDAGAGGGGEFMASLLMNEWTSSYDNHKKIHRGFIDKTDPFMHLREDDYPGNAENLMMFNFKRDKVEAYQNLQDLINQGLLIFPKSLNTRYEIEFEEENADGEPVIRYEKVDRESMEALIQIDLLKEEICGFTKTKKDNGTVIFETSKEGKSRGLEDNRADTLAQIAFVIMKLRTADALDKDQPTSDFGKVFIGKKKQQNNHRREKPVNPFITKAGNPFRRQ